MVQIIQIWYGIRKESDISWLENKNEQNKQSGTKTKFLFQFFDFARKNRQSEISQTWWLRVD